MQAQASICSPADPIQHRVTSGGRRPPGLPIMTVCAQRSRLRGITIIIIIIVCHPRHPFGWSRGELKNLGRSGETMWRSVPTGRTAFAGKNVGVALHGCSAGRWYCTPRTLSLEQLYHSTPSNPAIQLIAVAKKLNAPTPKAKQDMIHAALSSVHTSCLGWPLGKGDLDFHNSPIDRAVQKAGIRPSGADILVVSDLP